MNGPADTLAMKVSATDPVPDHATSSMRAILDGSPVAILISEMDTGIIRYANRQAFAVLGLVAHGQVHVPAAQFRIDADDRRRMLEGLTREKFASAEVVLKSRDGEQLHVALSCQFNPENSHEILWWIIDITAQKETQKQLHQTKQMLERIVEQLPVALWAKDINDDFRYTIFNRACEQLFGIPADVVLGHTEFEFMDAGKARKIRQEDMEIVRSGQILDIHEERTNADSGEIQFGHLIRFPIPDAEGNPDLILGICENLTEQKEADIALRNSESRFQQLAENAPVGIFMTDPRGSCIYVNAQWQKMAGLDQEQAAGMGWIRALHEEDTSAVSHAWQNFVAGGSDFNLEYRFTRSSGQVTWVSGKSVALRNEAGEVVGFLGSTADITQHKRFEAALELSRDEAQRANAAKSEFLSRMSHELRTPLNAVLGFGQLLQMDSGNLTPDQNEGIRHILAGGEHLLYLIEDVLDFARIETGHMGVTLKKFCLDPVLRCSFSLVGSLAQRHQVTLLTPCGPTAEVIGDPQRTQQVLINLLSNAIKYNKTGGTVEVSACAQPQNMLRTSIKDSGQGIPSADQARLFHPFERVTLLGRAIEGTGIGLSICQKLVELMGGRIGFESEFGIGSTFWFDLPAALATTSIDSLPGDVSVPVLNENEIEGVRILWVEHDLPSIRLMVDVTRLLPRCEFTAAKSASDGVAMAKSSPPDLILMDTDLPGLGGFEALILLQNDKRTREIPVIALSANASPEMVAKATAAGFAHVMAKPLNMDCLFPVIASVYRTLA